MVGMLPEPSLSNGRFGQWANGPLSASTTPSSTPSAPSASVGRSNLPSTFGGASPGLGTGEYGGNGGSYGVSGNGAMPSASNGTSGTGDIGASGFGPGGSESVGGRNIMTFDDGGEIPDNQADPDSDGDNDGDNNGDEGDSQLPPGNDQNANQQGADPMQIIQNALGMGRQSMGLPTTFYGDQSQGALGGDVIPAPVGSPEAQIKNLDALRGAAPLDPTNVIPMPNLKQRLQDTAGKSYDDGGVIPDPQQQNPGSSGTGSQLPDPRKTMAYLAGAGNIPPDAAAALEQRVDPQGQMDPAERKLSAIMAAGSPQAQFGLMQHYRTRFNAYSAGAQAALDQGNMAQAAVHATNAMAHVPSGYSVKFAPTKGGLAVQAKKIGQSGQQTQQGYADGGAVDTDNPAVVMRSYDDGGETDNTIGDPMGMGAVPDQSNQVNPLQGVIPNATSAVGGAWNSLINGPNDPNSIESQGVQGAKALAGGVGNAWNSLKSGPGTPVSGEGAQISDPGGGPNPTVTLPPSSLKDLFKSGWDKLVESGLPQMNRSNAGGLPGILNSIAGASKAIPYGLNKAASGLNYGADWITGSGPFESTSAPDVQAAVASDNTEQPASSTKTLSPQPQAGGISQALKTQDRLPQTQPKPARDVLQEHAQAQYNRSPKALENTQQNAAALERTNAMWGNRANIENNKIQHQDARAANSVAERLAAVQITVGNRAANAQQSDLVRFVAQQLTANPQLASDPDKVLQAIQPYIAKLRQVGASPQDVLRAIQNAQAPAAQAPGQDLLSNQPKVTSKADYDALESGATFTGPDGKTWHKP